MHCHSQAVNRTTQACAPNSPLVAIVTPVFNGGRYLAETMESIQKQDYPNIIHCVLDNASTDETADIIARFSRGRVPVSTARNEATIPVIDNWNAALRLIPAQAEYFRILPADDTVDPTYVSKLVAFGEQHRDVNVIACQERRGPILIGTGAPFNQVIVDGRALMRGFLLREIELPADHCLYRVPATGLPSNYFHYEYHGTKLHCTDTDATFRQLSCSRFGMVQEPLASTRWPGAVTSAEVLPNHVGIWSILQMMDSWGPIAFDSRAEYLAARNAHLRSYFLHLLVWKIQGRNDLVDRHLEWLGRASASPTLTGYFRSVLQGPVLLANGWMRRRSYRVSPSAG